MDDGVKVGCEREIDVCGKKGEDCPSTSSALGFFASIGGEASGDFLDEKDELLLDILMEACLKTNESGLMLCCLIMVRLWG